MQKSITRFLLYVSILLPTVILCLFLWYFALDIPQGDDFELILNFLSEYLSKDATLQQKFALITEQWVEHRLAYTRIAVLFQYFLTGQVSFYLIILIGNLSLAGILFVCWRQLQHAGYPLYYFIPISLLLCQPCYSYDGLLWPAATLAYNSVSFFTILTIHFLSNQRLLYFGLATVSAILCVYTFGNGMLILVAGAGVLLIQKRYKELIIWGGLTLLIISIYFSNYQHYENRNNPFHNLIHHSVYIFINILIFLGSALNWNEQCFKVVTPADLPSMIAGAGVLIAFFFVLFSNLASWLRPQPDKAIDSKQQRYNAFLLGSLSFFVLTAILLCVSRVDKDMVFAHTNRYRINSVAGLIIAYCAILRFFKGKPVYYALITTSVGAVYILSFFHFYSIFAEYKRAFTAAQYNWVTTHQWFIYRDTSYWEESSKIIMKNVEQNLNYRITTSPFSKITIKEEALPNVKVERTESTKHLKISGIAAITHPFSKVDNDYYIAFKNMSTSTTYLVAAQYDRRSIRLVAMGEDYYYPNFHITLPYRHFPTGSYRIGVAHSKSNELEINWQPFTFNNVQESNLVN